MLGKLQGVYDAERTPRPGGCAPDGQGQIQDELFAVLSVREVVLKRKRKRIEEAQSVCRANLVSMGSTTFIRGEQAQIFGD